MTVPGRSRARQQAVARAGSRHPRTFPRIMDLDGTPLRTSEYFGTATFSFDLMDKLLAPADVQTLRGAATSKEPLGRDLADKVARVVRDWAINKGATHYCHWFQPQTGLTAEKHDSFFAFDKNGSAIEYFTGSQLIQAEPDASSFPSGGVRATFEARGYTAWDASSPMFLMQTENGLTLCIPSLFISYGGEALDEKTALLRSLAALSDRAVTALGLLGHDDVKFVSTTAGPEQEYFLIDEAFYNLRPDLILAGRTLVGRTPPRHQQLEDHYFGSIKPRILAFMMEAEQELYRLGVPVKTRHNEVAPSQCEAAPIFENANVAADHNQLMMEVIKSVARRHRLVALFHEKPYAGINGSGKHVNWSLADSHGHNLLEPGDKPQENLRFLYFFTAAVKAVHDHGTLLRAAIATPGNDFRLGANEAPPAIISTFLGETMTEVLDRIADGSTGQWTERTRQINLDLAKVPLVRRDNTDRNRTSPFAFTGNKFEFRAVGASASISMPLTLLNAAMTHALDDMNRRLQDKSGGRQATDEQILAVIQEVIQATRRIRFEGDNYSEAWHQEAAQRGLANLKTTPDALRVLKDPEVQSMLAKLGIMSQSETQARYNVRLERYVKVRMIELECLQELVTTHILPAGYTQLAALKAAGAPELVGLRQVHDQIVTLVADLLERKKALDSLLQSYRTTHDEETIAGDLATRGLEVMTALRATCNELEQLVDDELWSLPKYREMLYLQ